MRRAANPPIPGAPGRRPGDEAGALKGAPDGGGVPLSEMLACLRAAVAESTETGLFGARLAN